MAFTAKSRIPTRPLSYSNSNLAVKKELLVDWENHKIYICDSNKNIVEVTGSGSGNVEIFAGATSTEDGTSGSVPAPSAGEQNKFLKADGTWNSIKCLQLDSDDNLIGLKMKDRSNGYNYIVAIDNGTLASYCAVASIAVTTNPTKMTYTAGEYIDTTGIVVTATLEDGSVVQLDDIVCDNYVTVENPVFIIKYDDISTELEVTVTEFDPAVVLVDFTYTDNGNGTYTITGWKGTYNGETSSEMIVPNNAYVIV